MKAVCILAIFILTVINAQAQKQGQALIDSLKSEYSKQSEDSSKVVILSTISFEYSYIQTDSGISYGERGLRLAEKINFKSGIAYSLNSLAINYSQRTNFEKALYLYYRALRINEERDDKKGISANLANIGNIYFEQKDYQKALDSYFKALAVAKQIDNKYIIALHLGNIALMYGYLGNTDKALEYYLKSIGILQQMNKRSEVAYKLTLVGDIYAGKDEFSNAMKYYTKAMKLSKELGDEYAIAANYQSMGMLLARLPDSSAKDLNSRLVPVEKKARLAKSIEYLGKAIDVYSKIDLQSSLITVYEQISSAYEKTGDYKASLYYHKKYADLRDSIFTVESRKIIESTDLKGQLAVKDLKIEQNQILYRKDKKISTIVVHGSMTVIFILALIILIVIYERKKSEKLLLNILPNEIAKRLKGKEKVIADRFEGASIIFIDIVDFTELSEEVEAENIVAMLNDIFTTMDEIAMKYNMEKIKTIGDCYMAAAGIPQRMAYHADAAADMALEVREKMKNYTTPEGIPIKFRIGLDAGPVVAGVIGESKFIYDLWGDAVNTASRMEAYGVIDEIQVTHRFITFLHKGYLFLDRGQVEIKGKGLMNTFLLLDSAKETRILKKKPRVA